MSLDSAQRDHDLQRLERKILGAVGRAVADFSLIEQGDRVLVGVSGGKDSYTLLRVLRLLQQRAPVRFELAAVNLDPGYPGYRPQVVRDYVEQLGLPIHMLTAPINELVQEKIAPGAPACPLCSRMRRGAFYSLCREQGFNKLALGHHLDDAVETLLMNMCYAGAMRGMAPLLRRAETPQVIRPLCYLLERDVARYAEALDFPIIPCASANCADADRRRQVIKRMLAGLEAEHPDIKHNLRRALGNIDIETLFARRLPGPQDEPGDSADRRSAELPAAES